MDALGLQLELLLASPGGDLVLGECKMRVSDVVAAGAVHSWFPFIDAGEPTLKTGELLMAIQAKGSQGRRRSTDANGQSVTLFFGVEARLQGRIAQAGSRFACRLSGQATCQSQ